MHVQDMGMGVVHVFGVRHSDARGSLTEVFRSDHLYAVSDQGHVWVQGNLSVNRMGVFRGIHFSTAPGGQAKYVTCANGSIYDFAVDLRSGSPTFGKSVTVFLSSGDSVYVPTGFGHGFVSVADDTIVTYLLSAKYNPDNEHTVIPEGLCDPWWRARSHGWVDSLVMSDRDAGALSLSEYVAEGHPLPTYHHDV